MFAGLPTGLPEIDLRPPIREKTDASIGAKTAPTKCSLPLGFITLRNTFQSNLTFTVEMIKSNLEPSAFILELSILIQFPQI